jgi:hypothetical protein
MTARAECRLERALFSRWRALPVGAAAQESGNPAAEWLARQPAAMCFQGHLLLVKHPHHSIDRDWQL